MSISMRDLFQRQAIANQVISLRDCLSNHQNGISLGLADATLQFLQLANGDGFARGCHRPSQAVAGDLAYVVPSWVAVNPGETRILEGVLTKSKVTHTDFPLRPWHTYYDWNFFIQLDKQYTYLHSLSNIRDHNNLIECEWDTAFLPAWAWPQEGSRIWMVGRWIYDCGHPGTNGHKTEIHPPKAIATFRSEAVQFSGNSGPTRANSAVLYIGRKGGYWQQSINNQAYAFDLYLPPKPHANAIPRWRITPQTGALLVQPSIQPFPADNPKALRVVIPLEGVTPHPDEYGAIISGGWSDPTGSEAQAVKHVRVRMEKIFMDGDYDTFGDEWYVYVGINGRWKVWKSIGGASETLNFTVNLDLHPTDSIHVNAFGFEADLMHDHMGDNSGYSWSQISNPAITTAQRESIEDDIFWQLAGSFKDENDAIGYFSHRHSAATRGTITLGSDKGDFRLRYSIEEQ